MVITKEILQRLSIKERVVLLEAQMSWIHSLLKVARRHETMEGDAAALSVAQPANLETRIVSEYERVLAEEPLAEVAHELET